MTHFYRHNQRFKVFGAHGTTCAAVEDPDPGHFELGVVNGTDLVQVFDLILGHASRHGSCRAGAAAKEWIDDC